MINLEIGKIIDLRKCISIKKGQTISKRLTNREDGLRLFSMYNGTDISQEAYGTTRAYICIMGNLKFKDKILKENEMIAFEKDEYFEIVANSNSVFLEIFENKGDIMINLEKGKVLDLKSLIDYEDGGISNLDLNSENGTKIMLMAFDKGEGLSPHKAPADALILALQGEAEVLVGEETFELKEGQQIVFPKDVLHNVSAKTKFKMLLILPK
ncbi:MAG: cupin domain-containing protein [Tissierellia bacterium]|nr:cupin domain-containing protein [Tissierellia bacterium]